MAITMAAWPAFASPGDRATPAATNAAVAAPRMPPLKPNPSFILLTSLRHYFLKLLNCNIIITQFF